MTDLLAYRALWHPVAWSTDVVADRPTRLQLLGERLVAFRTDDGVSVFKDLCIHRGSALSLGRIVDGELECGYHGWRYDGTGRCTAIPALVAGSPIPAKANAITYDVREYAGIVFVALEEPTAPLPEFRADYDPYTDPSLRLTQVKVYEWAADCGRVMENFMDVAHFPFVHPNTLAAPDDVLIDPHEVEYDDHSLTFTHMQVEPADPMTGHVGDPIALNYYYRAPYSVHLKRVVPTEESEFMVISMFACPIDAETSRMFVTLQRNFHTEPENDQRFHDFVDMVQMQDKDIVESVKPEEIPVDLREELHIKVPDAAGMRMRRILGNIERDAAARCVSA